MHQLNEDIRDKELRLIGSGGEQLGIMSADEALRIVDEKGMDLVKISPQATPPVCKLMDYGKFRFEQGCLFFEVFLSYIKPYSFHNHLLY